MSELPESDELFSGIDHRPPAKGWMETPATIRKGMYCYASNPKSVEYIGRPNAREWNPMDEDWKLPDMLIEAACFHHSPHAARNFHQACQIIFIANEIAQAEKLDESFYKRVNSDQDAQQLGYDLEKMAEALEMANSQFAEMSAMFSL